MTVKTSDDKKERKKEQTQVDALLKQSFPRGGH